MKKKWCGFNHRFPVSTAGERKKRANRREMRTPSSALSSLSKDSLYSLFVLESRTALQICIVRGCETNAGAASAFSGTTPASRSGTKTNAAVTAALKASATTHARRAPAVAGAGATTVSSGAVNLQNGCCFQHGDCQRDGQRDRRKIYTCCVFHFKFVRSSCRVFR